MRQSLPLKLAAIAARSHQPGISSVYIATGTNANRDVVRVDVLKVNSLTTYNNAIAVRAQS